MELHSTMHAPTLDQVSMLLHKPGRLLAIVAQWNKAMSGRHKQQHIVLTQSSVSESNCMCIKESSLSIFSCIVSSSREFPCSKPDVSSFGCNCRDPYIISQKEGVSMMSLRSVRRMQYTPLRDRQSDRLTSELCKRGDSAGLCHIER